jgi:signal transduction histidine kinase
MSSEPIENRKAASSSEAELQAHFAKLEAQFDRLRAQVRQAQQLSSLGTAAAMIAHEVNNLLTPILGYAQAAEQADDPQLMKRALAVTIRNCQVLIAMSDRVLNVSAARSTTPEAVNLRKVIEEARASLCRDLDKDGIRFSCQVDESVWVWADPLQLQQVFFNLFLNAREAMAPSHSGRLALTGMLHGDRVVIEVRNTGPAISAERLPHIFDALESSKSIDGHGPTRCSGLGLALCRDLIEENHGTIRAASDETAGTTFTLTLPACPQVQPATA